MKILREKYSLSKSPIATPIWRKRDAPLTRVDKTGSAAAIIGEILAIGRLAGVPAGEQDNLPPVAKTTAYLAKLVYLAVGLTGQVYAEPSKDSSRNARIEAAAAYAEIAAIRDTAEAEKAHKETIEGYVQQENGATITAASTPAREDSLPSICCCTWKRVAAAVVRRS